MALPRRIPNTPQDLDYMETVTQRERREGGAAPTRTLQRMSGLSTLMSCG